jgi:chorismate-pyruvate lyase
MNQTTPTTKAGPDAAAPRAAAGEAYPMEEYYARHRLKMPLVKRLEPDQVPEPYHGLLVHDRDMTSRLESFHKRKVHIRLLNRRLHGSEYFREVALELDGSRKPVEFGAIKINLDLFAAEAREEIRRELRPLGRILHTFDIAFMSRPSAYLLVAADSFIGGALGLKGKHSLYGRRNTLLDAWERTLAEIVEILPP